SAVVRGGVRVLDHAGLVAPDRGLIVPGDPDASTLITRVRSGSMPPGRRSKLPPEQVEALAAWVAAGAPAFSGDDHVVRHVLDRALRLDPRTRRYARYLSLDHLLGRPDAARELARRRDAVAGVLRHFAGRKDDLLRKVDQAGLLFRIDLRDFE